MKKQNTPQKPTEAVQEARKTVDELTQVLTCFFGSLYALGRQYAMDGKPTPDYDTFYEAADLFFAEHSGEAAVLLEEAFSRGYTFDTPEPVQAVQEAVEASKPLVIILADFLDELTAKGYQYAANLEVFAPDIPEPGTGKPISAYRHAHSSPGATHTLKIQMQAAFVAAGGKA